MHIVDAYRRTRSRVVSLMAEASADEIRRTVPACPDWTVRDLTAHVVSMPVALSAGRVPDRDISSWLELLIEERAHQTVPDLLTEWEGLDEQLAALLTGPAGLLFDDLAIHEHDLRGALGKPDHGALEVEDVIPRVLAAFAEPLAREGLSPIAVRSGQRSWQSHQGQAGWTLLTDPWESLRALSSRRTVHELRELACEGAPDPFLVVLNTHLPLPARSLAEQ